MNKEIQRGFISPSGIGAMLIMLIVAGVVIGAGLALGLPALWELVKPFLHRVTA